VAVAAMEDLSSPVGAFIRDCCDIGPGQRAWVDELYEAWKQWCKEDGRMSATTRQRFGRDVLAAVPGIRCRRNRNVSQRFYEGIRVAQSRVGGDLMP
jgi:putative DNA primase/helicase